jgi:uncharacterized protein YdaT
MPFTGSSFASRHNHAMKANPKVARKAAKMANAMMREGVDEGVAIATANKRAPGAAQKEARSAGAKLKEHNQRRPYA